MHNVYNDYFSASENLQPGQIKATVLSVNNSPSVKIEQAEMVTVTLTLHDDSKDLDIRKNGGVVAARQHKLERICNEAFMQGGLLTIEDIANRIFNCGDRTIIRDLKDFRDKGVVLPLRSTIKDMGRTLSHRKLIIEKWLNGDEFSEIQRKTNHSIDAINNYIKKFKQVVALSLEGYEVNTIAFLIKISANLVETYIKLWNELKAVAHRKKEIETLVLKKN